MAYNLLKPVKIVDAVSMGANITSAIIETQLQDNIGIQLDWTGTPVGTFDVQVSMNHLQDAQGNVIRAGTWVSLPLSPAIAAAGVADVAYIDLTQISASYVRIVYTRTSSTGVLTAMMTGKGI